jgi:hypothetical protein
MAGVSDADAKYPARQFARVRTDFTLDPGRGPRRPGYRPLWRIKRGSEDPLMVGMCELALVDDGEIQPGETRRAEWAFWPGVQGYVEQYLQAGDEVDVCDGGTRIGGVRVVEFIY